MPSPIGHSIISLGVYYLSKSRFGKITREWKRLIFILILGNLPDLDFIPGALIGDLNRYHETYTHTLGFAFIVSFFIWLVLFLCRHKELYKITFLSFVLLYVHIISDSLNMDSRPPIGVMMFWPFTDRYFYMRTPLIYPFDRQNLENIFSPNSLFALFTELAVSIPLLVLGIISAKKKKWKKRIIYVLLSILSIFIFFGLTIYREDHTPMESDMVSKLNGQIVFSSNRSG